MEILLIECTVWQSPRGYESIIKDMQMYTKIGSKHDVVNVSGAGIVQILAPTDNVAGAVITTCALGVDYNVFAAIFTQVSPPTPGSPLSRSVFSARGTDSSLREIVNMPFPLEVPAGWGLWLGTVTSTSGGAGANITYDLYTA